MGDGLMQCIKNEAGGHRCRDGPTQNLARKDNNPSVIVHSHPCQHIGEVGHPELV